MAAFKANGLSHKVEIMINDKNSCKRINNMTTQPTGRNPKVRNGMFPTWGTFQEIRLHERNPMITIRNNTSRSVRKVQWGGALRLVKLSYTFWLPTTSYGPGAVVRGHFRNHLDIHTNILLLQINKNNGNILQNVNDPSL